MGLQQPDLVEDVPAMEGELKLNDLSGLFQPKSFYDSISL